MKLVTDWYHLLKDITSYGNSNATENIMYVEFLY